MFPFKFKLELIQENAQSGNLIWGQDSTARNPAATVFAFQTSRSVQSFNEHFDRRSNWVNQQANWFEADATCRRYGMTLVNGDFRDAQAFNQTLTNSQRDRQWWYSAVIAARGRVVSGTTGHREPNGAPASARNGVYCATLHPIRTHFYEGACKDSVNFACQLYNPSYFLTP